MLRSILIVCGALFLAGCFFGRPVDLPLKAKVKEWTDSAKQPTSDAERELHRQMWQLVDAAESCMTEKQCEQSKKRGLENCETAKANAAQACRLRWKTMYESCCADLGYNCSSCRDLKYNNCAKPKCTWTTNCKTAENIVTTNDIDSLRECCDRKGEGELERCNKIMFSEQECQRIEKIEINACMRKSPASKAYSYTERAPEPLKPSTPSVGTPASTPVESSQPSEY